MSYNIGCKVQSAGWQARLRVEERSVPSFVKSETATEDATSSFKETRKIGENALEDPDASEDEVAVDRKLYACEGDEKGRKLQEFVDEFILNQEVKFCDPGEDDEPTPAERAAKAIDRRLKKEQENGDTDQLEKLQALIDEVGWDTVVTAMKETVVSDKYESVVQAACWCPNGWEIRVWNRVELS